MHMYYIYAQICIIYVCMCMYYGYLALLVSPWVPAPPINGNRGVVKLYMAAK